MHQFRNAVKTTDCESINKIITKLMFPTSYNSINDNQEHKQKHYQIYIMILIRHIKIYRHHLP